MKRLLLLLAIALPAYAADLTIVAPCSSWGISGNTVTCNAQSTAPTAPTPPPVVAPVASCGQVLPVVSNVRGYSSGFSTQSLVVKFTTGPNTGFGRIAVAEYGDGPVYRTAVLSAKPCDFGAQARATALQVGSTATVNFTVGPNFWGFPELAPNTTYYLNVKNEYNGAATCEGRCEVSVDLKLP